MIQRVLVANRGEIARRVFATCRRLGIGTVAVYSDADEALPFAREADLAVRLPGRTPAETYLRGDLVVEAARTAGADAVHPGYGFLSENAGFARAVIAAGLTWIGPAPESIEAMGSKVAAKKLMAAAGVPVFGEVDPATATDADLPLLVKASAGGGGRGMRIVRSLDRLAEQVELASAEAESAFGDPTVFCEPYLEHGRHVEVQVLGDSHGHVLILGDRDCSIQRRHQKVVEEAPAPGLAPEVRATLHDGARLAAEAISYVGAGTVEFMVSGDKVSFLEMNTRLQVEHPVTEAVFGVDLVEQQIRVAEGARLTSSAQVAARATTSALDPKGHAVEVRLYAEDPSAGYQPQSGRLDTLEIAADVEFTGLATYGVRLDSGFESGNDVGTHYDAMLAKVIAWGEDRATAFRALAGVLERARIHGLVTNRDLLVRLLRDEKVLAGEVSTDVLDGFDLAADSDVDQLSAAVAALALAERDRARRRVQKGIPVGWRNVFSQQQRTTLAVVTGDEFDVAWSGGRDGYRLDDCSRVLEVTPDHVVLEVDGVTVRHDVVIAGDTVHVDSGRRSASYRLVPRFADPAAQVSAGSLLAPMPGTVIAVPAESGSAVVVGQAILVLEAMKMQHTINAPAAGVLEVAVSVGQQVSAGDVLAVVSAAEGDEG